MEYQYLQRWIQEPRHLAKGPDLDPTKGSAGSVAAADRLRRSELSLEDAARTAALVH
jgi:hypothetical protein